MAISFVRVDDRVIHGQLVTRWAKERECDGIIAIDDSVAADPLLSQVMIGAITGVKVWLFDLASAIERLPKALSSDKKYFLLGKSPEVFRALCEAGINLTNDNGCINVGPMSARADAITIGPNQSVTPSEIMAFDYLSAQGYRIDFRLVPDGRGYTWEDAKRTLSKAGALTQ